MESLDGKRIFPRSSLGKVGGSVPEVLTATGESQINKMIADSFFNIACTLIVGSRHTWMFGKTLLVLKPECLRRNVKENGDESDRSPVVPTKLTLSQLRPSSRDDPRNRVALECN
ncbi:hypothetical protein KIN20_019155 [Parelaphostrongylus tenuis]|uniref:Uncharacterized protein n=1 Tax=Parelaphostrongylus tenuis TaxID=148309 RepID=A0AAD5N539_PARTN|nr:hypothetical protein KIN20_019155 [Parelaphostrongylus tenuis]